MVLFCAGLDADGTSCTSKPIEWPDMYGKAYRRPGASCKIPNIPNPWGKNADDTPLASTSLYSPVKIPKRKNSSTRIS